MVTNPSTALHTTLQLNTDFHALTDSTLFSKLDSNKLRFNVKNEMTRVRTPVTGNSLRSISIRITISELSSILITILCKLINYNYN